MKLLVKLFRKFIIRALVDEIKDEDTKKKVVLSISKKLDTGKLSEEQEAEIISSLYDAIEAVIVSVVAIGRD